MSAKSLILSLYLLLVAATVNAQYWRQFDNEWIPVTLDDNVSLQFPADPLSKFETNGPASRGIGTKKKLTYYYAKYIDRDSAASNITYLYDSFVNQAHYDSKVAMDSVRQILYTSYIQQLANMHGTTINHVNIGADGVPGYWLEFTQRISRVYAYTRQCIFYCNDRLYVVEFYCSLDIDKYALKNIWNKYINSVHVKNKN